VSILEDIDKHVPTRTRHPRARDSSEENPA
jgi:hypothetical protein